ncbi:MAG: hypothetical protein WAZ19_08125 [Anaerolineae bacterium]
MRAVDWSEINWAQVALNWMYALVMALALAFVGRLAGLENWSQFNAAFTLALALLVMMISFRLALRVGREPVAHGLLLGGLVGLSTLVLNYLTIGLGLPELAGFLMQIVAGFMGGRMASRARGGNRR